MRTSARGFRHRAFVAMVMVFSGLALPLTGIANHVYGAESPSVARHAWMSAHNALGLLFVVFSVWHIVLNRRALWRHVRRSAASVSRVSREAILAGLVVAAALVLFVGHAFHVGQ